MVIRENFITPPKIKVLVINLSICNASLKITTYQKLIQLPSNGRVGFLHRSQVIDKLCRKIVTTSAWFGSNEKCILRTRWQR